MVDLKEAIPYFGTLDSRGEAAIKYLKDNNLKSGVFKHNDIVLTVYADSTIRELGWQYQALSLYRL